MSKLSFTLLLLCPIRLRNDEGDLPVALASSCYAASFLAHTPLGEGWLLTGLATVIDGLVPARRPRRSLGCEGKEGVDVEGHEH